MRSRKLTPVILLTWGSLSNSFNLGPRERISCARFAVGKDLPGDDTSSVDVDKRRLEKKETWERKDLFGTTLLDQTLDEMKSDDDFQAMVKRTNEIGVAGMAIEERTNRRRALDSLGIPEFKTFMGQQMNNDGSLHRHEPQILQINIGLYCNQACGHCHVESSPYGQK
ncbi:DUF3641-containing protein [Fragilaria crotonensis]|nr:DUF3641-containing protein [Fragilaria crotonensis]